MGYARKAKQGSGRAMLEEMNKQDTLRGVIMPSAKSPFSALPVGAAKLHGFSALPGAAKFHGFSALPGAAKLHGFSALPVGAAKLHGFSALPLGAAQSQDSARAFNLVIGDVKTGMESIDSLTSSESLDRALRPTSANPFIHIRKRAPRKTATGPIARLRNLGHPIAASYCKDAVELLELGYYKSSTHSSICAVESVARDVSPNEDRDLKKIINQMRADGAIHPAYAEMVMRLWGYCSDRPGMRHADYESSPFPAVGAKEARMLIGICPAIAEYLADTQD